MKRILILTIALAVCTMTNILPAKALNATDTAGVGLPQSGLFENATFITPTPKPETAADKEVIKAAIEKYKNKNYIGCISDLRLFTQKNPSSAISWYYLGNAYMYIAMKKEAIDAFDRVIMLNSVPMLTSYALQAELCMENPLNCRYQDFTYEELIQFRADPKKFIADYNEEKNKPAEVKPKDINEAEIEKLIDGYYTNNIHPTAKDFITQERLKINRNN